MDSMAALDNYMNSNGWILRIGTSDGRKYAMDGSFPWADASNRGLDSIDG